jgi:hypothetical protein
MSAEVRGADYGATARLLSRGSATDGGKEVSVSYLQVGVHSVHIARISAISPYF